MLILNAQSEYQNRVNEIDKMKQKNKVNFEGINYPIFNFFNSVNSFIFESISNKNNSDEINNKIYSGNDYKNYQDQVNYFISGINLNNESEKGYEALFLKNEEK